MIVYRKIFKWLLLIVLRACRIVSLSIKYTATEWADLSFSIPTGNVMHHQFNIQQLYALPTLYLWVLYLSENKQ